MASKTAGQDNQLHAIIWQRVYTISVVNPAGPPPTRHVTGNPEDQPLTQEPLKTGGPALTGLNFYLTSRSALQPSCSRSLSPLVRSPRSSLP